VRFNIDLSKFSLPNKQANKIVDKPLYIFLQVGFLRFAHFAVVYFNEISKHQDNKRKRAIVGTPWALFLNFCHISKTIASY